MRAQEAVVARGIRHSFGSIPALRGLDLRIPAGVIFGLIGPDGAGKTTFVRLLGGLLASDDGELRVLGHDPVRETASVRKALGYMPQRFALYPDLTVAENLRFYADLFRVHGSDFRARLEPLLAFSRLGPFADRRVAHLSGGMRQKLALCSALIHRPPLLLLDEPTTGVDPVSRREFWDLLREIVADPSRSGETTILLTTPYMDEASRCDEIALLAQGRLLAAGTPPDVLAGYPWKLIAVPARDPVRTRALCEGLPGAHSAHALGDRVHVAVDDASTHMEVVREALAAQGLPTEGLHPAKPSMEDLFVHLFRESQADRNESAGTEPGNGAQRKP